MLFYNIGIRLYAFAIILVSPFNAKAKLWLNGRKDWRKKYNDLMPKDKVRPVIWFHCASLGEFEMARPVIEKLREVHNEDLFILISFFSPSGYEIQKKYKVANAVVYLPIDTVANATTFMEIFKPTMAVFVKYEIWINFFRVIKKRNAELVLMNAVFRNEQRFFKWYGSIFRKALNMVDKIFVQNESSMVLLEKFGTKSEITGDTRYDRAMQIREQPKSVDDIKAWIGGQFCIVAGSTWPAEEKVIQHIIDKLPENIKWIITPHDVSKGHIDKIVDQFFERHVLLSVLGPVDYGKNVLIVDSVGKLSQIYSLANLAIVGGGFSGKLHNILEPAVYGIPILFGPNYSRFKEAVEMVEKKAAISFYDDTDIILYIEWFFYDHAMVDNVKATQTLIFEMNKGAVNKVFGYIQSRIDRAGA